ncbi:MAG TPA: hypothetical protein VHQ01_09995 [Pyrinomonadaceae bacterium]|nr:hypothetical protein [Pyrinomonadaceae bacterium]
MRSRVFDLVTNISIFAITLIAAASGFAQSTTDNVKSNETSGTSAIVAKDVRAVFDPETVAKNEPVNLDDSDRDSAPIIRGHKSDFRPSYLKDRSGYAASGKMPARTTGDDGWHFAFAPYLFITGLTGTIGARGRTANIDLSFSGILHNFDMGLVGAFEARKKKIVFTSDVLWIKLSQERDTPELSIRPQNLEQICSSGSRRAVIVSLSAKPAPSTYWAGSVS